MPTSLSTVQEALKEVYLDRIRDQLQSKIKTLMRIEKSDENIYTTSTGGKYVRFATRVRRNHGIGARNERETLPSALGNKYVDGEVPLTYQYASLDLSGQMFELATDNPQAFANLVDTEVKDLREGVKKDFNRQLYGTNTGILVVADSGSTTTLVNTAQGALQYLEIGMKVDVIDSDGSTVNNSGVFITDIAYDTGTVTLSKEQDSAVAMDVAVAANDFLVRFGNLNREITGFEQMVDDTGEVYGIDAATTPVWQSSVIDVSGALSEGVMVELQDKIYRKGGNKSSVIWCSQGVRRAYWQLLVQDRQFANTVDFKGGFKGLAFTTDEGDIPVMYDVDCQPGTQYHIDESELKMYETHDWDWMDRDGSMWQRVITSDGNQDAYQAQLYKYCEFATTRRNAHGKLTGITEPTESS